MARRKTKRKVKTLEHVLKRKGNHVRKKSRRTTKRRTATRSRTVHRMKSHKTTTRKEKKDPIYSRVTNPREFHIKVLQVRRDTLNFFQKHQEIIRIRDEKTLEEKCLEKINTELMERIKCLRGALPHVKEKNLPIKTEEVMLEEEENKILETTQKVQLNKQQIGDLQKELKDIEHKINTI